MLSARTLCAIAYAGMAATSAFAGTVSAGAAAPSVWYKPSQADISFYSTGSTAAALAATLTWKTGPFTADGAPAAQTLFTENKFPNPPFPNFKPTNGINHGLIGTSGSTKGPLNSIAAGNGTGISFYRPPNPNFRNTNYRCDFWVTATGTLGNIPGPKSYSSFMAAADPYPLFGDDLGLPYDPFVDLFIPLSMNRAELQPDTNGLAPSAAASWVVTYRTADETIRVANITATIDGVSVNIDPAAEIYRMPDGVEHAPTLNPADVLTGSELESLLLADLSADGILDTPLDLGFSLRSLDRPTTVYNDGWVAEISIDVEAEVANAIPTPGATVILAAAGLFASRRRR